MKALTYLAALSLICTSLSVFAAAPTADNYRGVIQGVLAKFDRDYNNLNPQGVPDPGALAIVEKFLKAMNTLNITGPTEIHSFTADGADTFGGCNVAGPNCDEMKIVVQNSAHQGSSTLFGESHAFDWDVIVWENTGSGFIKFFEGFYTPVAGTRGIGNISVISCSGCSTVGHSEIEWDGTGATYHLRSKMYDTRFDEHQNPQPYGGVILDAVYNPATGDMKLMASATNVCSSLGIDDSICSNGANDHKTGYSAILHGNTITGNVYLSGLQGADNSSSAVNGADAMCIKADHTEDLSGAACAADGINDFNGFSPYAPSDAPASWIVAGSPWPMNDVTDSPSF